MRQCRCGKLAADHHNPNRRKALPDDLPRSLTGRDVCSGTVIHLRREMAVVTTAQNQVSFYNPRQCERRLLMPAALKSLIRSFQPAVSNRPAIVERLF